MTTVFLIRHGRSRANAGEPTTDPELVSLTRDGEEEARRIAHFLTPYSSLDLIVTSPYLRTQQTARATRSLPVFRSVTREEWPVQEFTYLASMHQERSTAEERRPLREAYWEQCIPSFKDGPGSESFASFIGRVQSFMLRLQNTSYKTIAVFSHEQFINAVLWLIEYRDVATSASAMREFRKFLDENPLPNGAIVQLKLHPWRYERITEHLLQTTADPSPDAARVLARGRKLEPVR